MTGFGILRQGKSRVAGAKIAAIQVITYLLTSSIEIPGAFIHVKIASFPCISLLTTALVAVQEIITLKRKISQAF